MPRTVSKEFVHNGGVARVEQDQTGQLAVICTGCNMRTPVGGMAPGLNALAEHVNIPGAKAR